MSEKRNGTITPDLRHFADNRSKFPPEELVKYADRYVAWSADGLRILASGEDADEVEGNLEQVGVPLDNVVLSYVLPSDVALL